MQLIWIRKEVKSHLKNKKIIPKRKKWNLFIKSDSDLKSQQNLHKRIIIQIINKSKPKMV